MDPLLIDAMREVDELTPACPPIAPFEQFPLRWIGEFVPGTGAYVVQIQPDTRMVLLSNGERMPVEEFRDLERP